MTEKTPTVDILTYRRYIEAALEYAGGSHTFEDVVEQVAAGKLQFWPGVESAVVTGIIDEPQYRALNIFLAGGNLAELERMTPLILQWGRERGCRKAMFFGRPGWERSYLTRAGWTLSPNRLLEVALT